MKKVSDGYLENNLPLEAMWADIDYMQDYKDFTVDQKNFGDIGAYIADIKANHSIKFIPIVDAGIAQRNPAIDNYYAYDDGILEKVFIDSGAPNKYNHYIKQFTGQTWTGDAAYVDFTSDNGPKYWQDELVELNHRLNTGIDGIWLNSNEARNMLCNGVCY